MQSFWKGKIVNSQIVKIVFVFVIIVVFSVWIFFEVYHKYIDQILYEERLSQMKVVTSQLFEGIEGMMDNRWETVPKVIDWMILKSPIFWNYRSL